MRTPDQIWQTLSNERESICKEITTLFSTHNIKSLFVGAGATEDDDHNYCYCNIYNPSMGASEESRINRITVCDNEIRITPKDERFGDVYIEDCNIAEVAGIYETSYQLLEEALMVADKNGHQIYVGCNVKWNDPVVRWTDPHDRQEMPDKTFRVYSLYGGYVSICNKTRKVQVLPEELEVIDN